LSAGSVSVCAVTTLGINETRETDNERSINIGKIRLIEIMKVTAISPQGYFLISPKIPVQLRRLMECGTTDTPDCHQAPSSQPVH